MAQKKSMQSDESAETAARYVDEIVKNDAEAATKPAQAYRARYSVAPLLGVLFPILVGLTTFNVYSATRSHHVFDETEEEAAIFFTMMLARTDIEDYRDSTGTYPESLTVLGLEELGVGYARSNGGYELQASIGDSLVTYRRGEDISRIETAIEGLAELSQ